MVVAVLTGVKFKDGRDCRIWKALAAIKRIFRAIFRVRAWIVARRNAFPRPVLGGPPNKTMDRVCQACISDLASERALQVCSMSICVRVCACRSFSLCVCGCGWVGLDTRAHCSPLLCCTVSLVAGRLSVSLVWSMSAMVISCAASGMAEDDHGRRYSTRKKMAPLRWYINERKEYERKHESVTLKPMQCPGCVHVASYCQPHNRSCVSHVTDSRTACRPADGGGGSENRPENLSVCWVESWGSIRCLRQLCNQTAGYIAMRCISGFGLGGPDGPTRASCTRTSMCPCFDRRSPRCSASCMKTFMIAEIS